MGKARFKAIIASYLILVRDNKVLLLRRFNTGYEDGKYSLPAGHVDEGETFLDCAARESMEEAGVVVKPEDLKVAHVMHRYSVPGEEGNRVDVFFTAEKWDGNIENKEPNKCDDLNWFDLNNLPENVIPYIKQAIDCIKNNVIYSEHGWKV